MATTLFAGSLAYSVDDDKLREFFASVGKVVSARVIVDSATNKSKGFGFVEMSTEDEAKAAIAQLNHKELDGRQVLVSEARPRADRPRRAFDGGSERSGFFGRTNYSSSRNRRY